MDGTEHILNRLDDSPNFASFHGPEKLADDQPLAVRDCGVRRHERFREPGCR
jgi:hypothetical protein